LVVALHVLCRAQAESLRLQTELADALRKEARMQADAADAIAKFNNKVQQAKRQEDIMKAQVCTYSG
jgi:hypothetical protein